MDLSLSLLVGTLPDKESFGHELAMKPPLQPDGIVRPSHVDPDEDQLFVFRLLRRMRGLPPPDVVQVVLGCPDHLGVEGKVSDNIVPQGVDGGQV